MTEAKSTIIGRDENIIIIFCSIARGAVGKIWQPRRYIASINNRIVIHKYGRIFNVIIIILFVISIYNTRSNRRFILVGGGGRALSSLHNILSVLHRYLVVNWKPPAGKVKYLLRYYYRRYNNSVGVSLYVYIYTHEYIL